MPDELIKDGSIRNAIFRELEKGGTPKMAAEAGGISPRTLGSWLKRGRDELERRYLIEEGELNEKPLRRHNRYVNFYVRCMQARAESRNRMREWGFEAAAEGTAQGIKFVQWYLERTEPETFGTRTETITVKEEAKVAIAGPASDKVREIESIVQRQALATPPDPNEVLLQLLDGDEPEKPAIEGQVREITGEDDD